MLLIFRFAVFNFMSMIVIIVVVVRLVLLGSLPIDRHYLISIIPFLSRHFVIDNLRVYIRTVWIDNGGSLNY